MKKIMLFTLLKFVIISGFSQITGEVEYKMIIEINDFREQKTVLTFTDYQSMFRLSGTEKAPLALEEKFDVSESDDPGSGFVLNFTVGPKEYYPYVYTNHQNKELLSKEYKIHNGDLEHFVTVENTGIIKWNIQPESKELGGFGCRRATCIFRDRIYTAWFTEEIPVSFGPWKLHGLPGLILEAYDEEAGVQFLFTSIRIPVNSKTEIIPPADGIRISIREYAQIAEAGVDEYLRLLESKLPRGTTIELNSIGKSLDIERKYEY